MARLEEAIARMMPISEASDLLLRQLAYENATSYCQSLLRTICTTGTIQDFVKACLDASPTAIQGMAFAAALNRQTFDQFIKHPDRSRGRTGYSGRRREDTLIHNLRREGIWLVKMALILFLRVLALTV